MAATRRVPLSDLHPAEWNPRTITDVRFQQLCAAIEADPDFLDARPILAMQDGTIYAGNMRYRAAQHLGWLDVPAQVEDVTEQQAKERALRDNNQYGEWQEDELAAIVAELNEVGSDLQTLGFTVDELQGLMDASGLLGDHNTRTYGQRLMEADALLEHWQVRAGDLWVIPSLTSKGQCHRLACGDAADRALSRRLMAGEGLTPFVHAQVLVTDPPYGIDFEALSAGRAKAAHWGAVLGDRRQGSALREWLADVLLNWIEFMDDRAAYYIWAAPLAEGYETYHAILAAGLHVQSECIWGKSNLVLGHADYQWKHESVWYGFRKGTKHHWYGGRKQTTLWEIPKIGQEEYQHPMQKPTELFAIPMRNHTRLGELVLDPFAGSGTAFVAGEIEGRVVYGCDIDPAYCAVTLQRLQDMGLEPERMDAESPAAADPAASPAP